MADLVQIPENKLDKILSILDDLKSEIKGLKSSAQKEPPYGSEEWWEWSDNKAMDDMKAGRYKTFKSVKELTKHLDTLK